MLKGIKFKPIRHYFRCLEEFTDFTCLILRDAPVSILYSDSSCSLCFSFLSFCLICTFPNSAVYCSCLASCSHFYSFPCDSIESESFKKYMVCMNMFGDEYHYE